MKGPTFKIDKYDFKRGNRSRRVNKLFERVKMKMKRVPLDE